MRLQPGIRPGPRWESLQRSPDPLAGFKGAASRRGGGVEGREGRGRERMRRERKERGKEGGEGEGRGGCAVGTGPPIG